MSIKVINWPLFSTLGSTVISEFSIDSENHSTMTSWKTTMKYIGVVVLN